ncbi:MAG: hypothetical protein ACKKL6_00135 [Candidatus Komeilibacteria bacterium]
MKLKKLSNSKIGLLQALGVTAYCLLVSQVFRLMETLQPDVPDWVAATTMLLLLVISASVVGSLVFGYAAYSLLRKDVKEALHVLGYTLLYGIGIFMIILFFVSLS